jgi:hypothetical protein
LHFFYHISFFFYSHITTAFPILHFIIRSSLVEHYTHYTKAAGAFSTLHFNTWYFLFPSTTNFVEEIGLGKWDMGMLDQ